MGWMLAPRGNEHVPISRHGSSYKGYLIWGPEAAMPVSERSFLESSEKVLEISGTQDLWRRLRCLAARRTFWAGGAY